MIEEMLMVSLVSKDKVTVKWSIPTSSSDFVHLYFGHPYSHFRKALRLYDVTYIQFDGSNALEMHEFILKDKQEHWSIKGLKPNRSYCLEYGIKLSETEFFPLIRSKSIQTTEESNGHIEQQRIDSKPSAHLSSPKDSLPIWSEHVSTYSYYETTVPKGAKK
ncbi:DUF4912 domain-containing protein [Neobacillus sp. LXY-4]|uniref:DUF4912 domain-containing protein n=1 Tax=Neobacillus sp. LXY-4 TaxID=3379826 RepID=UPI003EDEC33F